MVIVSVLLVYPTHRRTNPQHYSSGSYTPNVLNISSAGISATADESKVSTKNGAHTSTPLSSNDTCFPQSAFHPGSLLQSASIDTVTSFPSAIIIFTES